MAEPTPLNTPLNAADKAKLLKQRDDAIRANGIKEGRQAERKEWCAALGVTAVEEATEIQVLRRDNKQLHQRHLRSDFAKFLAGAAVALMAMAAANASMGLLTQDAMRTGAAIGASNQHQPYVCEPGQRMPDGHTCGLPGN